MGKKLICIFIICLFAFSAFSQMQKYHRVRINLQGKNPLILVKNGIPIDHGKMALGRYFESDFSEQEINLINHLGFHTEIKIKDVEAYYENQDRPSEIQSYDLNTRDNNCSKKLLDYKTPSNYFEGEMGGYFTYEELLVILDWMKNSYPNIISKVDTIKGYKTQNGNHILYLKISDNADVKETEPEVLYTALHHAREPNSLSQMIFYMWYLLENYDTNPEIKYLVDNTEMYFVPCVNPDGYIINQKSKPKGGGLWRKNGRKDSAGKLVGVDLNRNYGYKWGFDDVGSSTNPGSETYRGEYAFSEPETAAIRELCTAHNFLLTLNYHTFGNLLVHPWGFSDQPTDEDELFKSMGFIMNSENNFKMGTGTETVGYTTNGDSDDYMYGEQIEKSKSYSYTPEVGPSFWPTKKDIDYLNKSCVIMNLSLPRLANSMISHRYVPKSSYSYNDTLKINFSKSSFKKESVLVDLSLDQVMGNNNSKAITIDLEQGQSVDVAMPFKIDPKKLSVGKNEIKVFVSKRYQGYTDIDSFFIEYFEGDKNEIFVDSASNGLDKWIVYGSWDITSIPDYFVSAPSAFTDSPSRKYSPNSRNVLSLEKGLDLTKAVNPILTFNTRWNIERGFDYASVFAYVPGQDTVWLCGNYTKPGTLDQKAGYPIYDGDQNTFVTEVMSLENFVGKNNVNIDFEMVADGGLEMDGIYIDDIEVKSFTPKIINNNNDLILHKDLVYPNPASSSITINRNINKVEIFDLLGRNMGTYHMSNTIDVSRLDDGMYLVKMTSDDAKVNIENLVIKK